MASAIPIDNPRIFPERQEDMMIYRKHRGVNLGSWFVLERWITESPYREAAGPGQSDLDVARGRNAKSILEKHWDTWIVEQDWNWIASVGINAVRIPIGYYHVCGADRSILDGTDFYPFFDVYQGAWRRVTNAIAAAHKRNISVMIDLHAASGKQNADAHSGTSNSPNFFNDPHNQRRGAYALTALTRALVAFISSPAHPVPLNNIIGIQLLNEPAPPNDKILQDFYTSTILELQKIAPGIPIYLGEFWRTDAYADYAARDLTPRLASNESAMIVLDHHLYRCFTPSDNNTPVAQHTRAIKEGETPNMLARVSEKMGRLGGGLVVAEWSGGLHPNSLASLPQSQHLQARKEFVQAQLETYERTCGGWYFWCYKKEYPGDIGWSFKEAFEKGVFDKRFGMLRKKRWWEGDFEKEDVRRTAALSVAKDAMYKRHVQYWSQYPNQTYQHERFVTGFDIGWYANWRYFDSLNPEDPKVSEIGFKHALAWRSSQSRTGNYWEYEQGFLQGCDSARADFIKVFG